MDTYSISAGTSVGNELAKEARTQNQFALSQNSILVGQAQNTLKNDKDAKRTDTEWKVGMDSYGGAEALGSAVQIGKKGATGLASDTLDNFRSAGNKVSNLVSGVKDTPKTPALGESLDLGAKPALKPADVGFTDSDAVTEGLAKNLTSDVGEGSRFGGLTEAGSVGRFLANRVGITSELGVEVGGKALGGIGGAISAGQDITQFATTGHIFKPGESGFSEAGNIMSMVGAGLDMASIAVPILAPLALATNIGSAIFGTIGAEQDDTNKISTDSKPPQQQTLDTHPAWSAIGMTASVHQPSVV
jgi:hypothetical protein